jgi:hypothetical protein
MKKGFGMNKFNSINLTGKSKLSVQMTDVEHTIPKKKKRNKTLPSDLQA